MTVESVSEIVASCSAMIEIAAPNLAGKPNGVDLVAVNSASYRYIEGATIDWRHTDLDELIVKFYRGEELLHEDMAGSVMGGQKNALCWLINKILEVGYSIPVGALLMTGAIGAPHPAQPGQYRAQFGDLKEVGFSVTD